MQRKQMPRSVGGIRPRWFPRPPRQPPSLLQNSVEMLRFPAPGQPPVREAGIRCAAIARTRFKDDVKDDVQGCVGVKRLLDRGVRV